jgi:hypothetical protein
MCVVLFAKVYINKMMLVYLYLNILSIDLLNAFDKLSMLGFILIASKHSKEYSNWIVKDLKQKLSPKGLGVRDD